VTAPVEVRARHSSHSLRYIGGLSSQARLDNRLRGHFAHERQKCQMSSPGGERYSMDEKRKANSRGISPRS